MSWVPSAIAVGGGLLSGKKGRNQAQQAANQATGALSQYWDTAQQQYQDLIGQALSALSDGEAEASDEILQGLGMSIEERTKFFDIAKDNLDWVVDFGKKGAKYANQFMDHYSDLIFNPDSIYDTEVYKSIKDRTIKEWGNFYSGKGLLGGNAQEAMVDRMAELGYNFLQGERDATLRGHTAALNQANLGANASSQIADLAWKTGNANANDISGAYTNLANLTGQFNQAPYLQNMANFIGGGTANLGNAIANANLAGGLGQSSIFGDLGNALITAGTSGFLNLPGNTPKADFSSGSVTGNSLWDRAFLTQSSFRPNGPMVPGPHQTLGGF